MEKSEKKKESKIKITEQSDRIMLKNKNSIHRNRDRKKSEISLDKSGKIGLLEGKKNLQKEIKLPKVENKYQKCKERTHKQKSLRSQKIFS